MAGAREVTYEVVKHLAKLEHGHPKFNTMNYYSVDIVKWNEGDPRLEVRDTYTDKDGNIRTGAGIKLSNQEARELAIALTSYFKSKDTALVIDDYDAPPAKEKSEKAKAIEAAEAKAAEAQAKNAELEARLLAMEEMMKSLPAAPTTPPQPSEAVA
jgi:hypothetical protein